MPATNSTALIQLSTVLGGKKLLAQSLSASEEMGRLFEFNVSALTEDKALDPSKLLGSHATVALELPGNKVRHFDGIVTAAGLDGAHGRHIRHRLVLRPWLWLLTRRADTRIFQKKTVIEILKAVFANYEHDIAEEYSGSFAPIEYCVQYRETDFNFVSRLIEEEGLHYFFRHAAGRHTLVLMNQLSAHKPYPGFDKIAFREDADAATNEEFITDWRTQFELQTGKVTLGDWNFETPATDLTASHASTLPDARPALEQYDPPGDYFKKPEGERYAKLRMEEIESRWLRVVGSGNVRGIAVGHRFALTEHLVSAQNAEHVVVSSRIDVSHDGYESGAGQAHFGCSFTAVKASGAFRLQRTTPKPTVPGPQTATVVGKSGEEIHTDAFGRVKVHFHWDRTGKRDENSSCWVRVAYPMAGKGFGIIAIPRIGQEVVVDFIEGDPDRPIITGTVYNAAVKVPYALPDHQTVATLKTRSSKGGGASNFNELRFEDKKGSEYIWFQAEKDYYQLVKHDAWQVVGNDQFRLVKKNLQEEIKENVQRTVGKDHKEKIGGHHSLEIGSDSGNKVAGKYGLKAGADLVLQSGAVISMKSGADMVQKVGANLGVDAAANVHIKAGANLVIEAGAMITLKAGGGSVVIGPANVAITGAMVMINSGGGGGSGSGASPKSPEPPKKPEPPKEPKDPLSHTDGSAPAGPSAAPAKAPPGKPPVQAKVLSNSDFKPAAAKPPVAALAASPAVGQSAAEQAKAAKKASWDCRKQQVQAVKAKAATMPPGPQRDKLESTADRFWADNVAREKALLSQAAYHPDQPPPPGWSSVSKDAEALKKLGLKPGDLRIDAPGGSNFGAEMYQPDPAVFGDDLNPTLAFKGTENKEDWKNNIAQGLNLESPYYAQAVFIGNRLGRSGEPVDITGHSLGGGLASAASRASGNDATTFNAAGLKDATVERYKGIPHVPDPDNIQAYRVEGELLTTVQEQSLAGTWEAAKLGAKGGSGVGGLIGGLGGKVVGALAGGALGALAKLGLSAGAPDAAGTPHTVKAIGTPLERHGIDQVIAGIDAELNEDQKVLTAVTGVECP